MKARIHRSQGFTLVELLSVIAIIAILIAILVPVTSSIRESAKKAQCASNLHQIGIALMGYAIDHKGRIPAGWPSEGRTLWEADPDNTAIHNPAGLGSLQYYGYLSGAQGVAVTGNARSRVFDCPTRTSSGWDAYSNWSDYWYNFTGSYYNSAGAMLNTLPQGRAIVFDFISQDTTVATHDSGTSSNVLYADGSVKCVSKAGLKSTNRQTCFNQ